MTGRLVALRHAPAASEPHTLLADSSLVHAELGWKPHRSSLDEIITDAWAALTDAQPHQEQSGARAAPL
ncbi:MAG: hypothetical protein ACRDRX_06265, partial [Pseudonocardiaceae bacterium]